MLDQIETDVPTCETCGFQGTALENRCPSCGLPTLLNRAAASHRRAVREAPVAESVSLADVESAEAGPFAVIPSDVEPWSTALGGRVYEGQRIVLVGAPGAGKSSEVFRLLAGVATRARSTLLISSEQALSTVAMLARRAGADVTRIRCVYAGDAAGFEASLAMMERERPSLVAIDSLSDLASKLGEFPARVLARLKEAADASGAAVLCIAHVRDDGKLRGGRTAEYDCDTEAVLSRAFLRVKKGRFPHVRVVRREPFKGEPRPAHTRPRAEVAPCRIAAPAARRSRGRAKS